MNIFGNYQTASFRGITFILEDESTDDGRKTVSHEFVNSDRRFVEDLGLIPVTFNILGFTHADDPPRPGFLERDALKEVLNKKGPGQLVHPMYGSIDVVPGPYTVSSSMNNAGKFIFRMVFKTQSSDLPVFQDPEFATIAKLAEVAQTARDTAAESAEELFEVATDQSFFDEMEEIYQDGVEKVREVMESIEEDVLRGLGLEDVDRLLRDPPGFLSNPEILFPALSNLYRQVSSAGALDKWIEATEDFTNILSGKGDTKRNRARTATSGTLISSLQVNSMINAHQSGADADYNTVTELEEAERKLDDLFQSIVYDPVDGSIINDVNFPDLKTTLLEMRSISKLIFTEKEQTTFKVVTFNSNTLSFLQTTYDLYTSLDNLAVINNLNSNINASNPKVPMQVVQEVG